MTTVPWRQRHTFDIKRRAAAMALAAAATLIAPARAKADEPRPLRYDPALDLGITTAGGFAWVSTELLKPILAPMTCHWCDRSPDGRDSLNGLDRAVRDALRWSASGTADTLSSLVGFVLVPLVTTGGNAAAAAHEGHIENGPIDALIIVEAAVLASDVNQAVKFTTGRERPFVHALAPEQKTGTAQPADNNLSFFSGHTALTFALATAGGTVASMRGYRWAPLIWAAGFTFASATGYLRIAGDRHYFTDVVASAAFGAGIGFALPYFFHRPVEGAPRSGGEVRQAEGVLSSIRVAPLGVGQGLSVVGIF